MKRPFTSHRVPSFHRVRAPGGFTIVELLVATALTLLMLSAVVTMFGRIGNSVTDARSTLEMSDRLRAAAVRLQMDLSGVTATMLPPRQAETNEGYFEYIEGPVGVAQSGGATIQPWDVAVNSTDNPGASPLPPDTTVIDFDDILMFTTRSNGRPFVGRCINALGGAMESDVAEIAWFVRGNTLYRRVLLVAPTAKISSSGSDPLGVSTQANDFRGFYANNDISVRYESSGGVNRVIANTLGDLTRRGSRYAHPADAFPFDARRWGRLGLPTLRECTATTNSTSTVWDLSNPPLPPALDNNMTNNYAKYPNLDSGQGFPQPDFWSNDSTKRTADNFLEKTSGDIDGVTRIAEDVILTHVIGFDVKAYDPGAPVYDPSGTIIGYGRYVDLGYDPSLSPASLFSHLGRTGVAAQTPPSPPANFKTGVQATATSARVYDTWSSDYETTGRFQTGGQTEKLAGQSVNGFDDSGSGIVDGPAEMLAPPPYPAPLRGIQVKIRAFEPDSRQIREITIVQDFLPK